MFAEYVDRVDSDFDESESSAEQEEVEEERKARPKRVYQDPRKKEVAVAAREAPG